MCSGCPRPTLVLPRTRVTTSGKQNPAQLARFSREPPQGGPRTNSCRDRVWRVRTWFCKPQVTPKPHLHPGSISLDPDNQAFHQIVQVGGKGTNMRLPPPAGPAPGRDDNSSQPAGTGEPPGCPHRTDASTLFQKGRPKPWAPPLTLPGPGPFANLHGDTRMPRREGTKSKELSAVPRLFKT